MAIVAIPGMQVLQESTAPPRPLQPPGRQRLATPPNVLSPADLASPIISLESHSLGDEMEDL